jgi:glycosyltransferase involved in cell wall biosynthesis
MTESAQARPARVAVVIPCFNSGATIEETLGSLAAEECEVVVVDDGSDDPRTLEVLRTIEESGVRVIHQANQGPARARTAGMRATSAPYVFPLDADDIVMPGALARLADALDAHPDAVVAWGYITSHPNGIFRPIPQIDPWLLTYVNPFAYLALFRRSVLEQHDGWPSTGVHEDWDLWMTLAEHGQQGIQIPVVTADYRPSPTGRWARGFRRYDDRIVEIRGAHPDLFRDRRANWRTSVAPIRCRILLPVIAKLPLRESNKRRLYDFVYRPIGMGRALVRRPFRDRAPKTKNPA